MIYLCSVYSYTPEGVPSEDMPALMQKRYEYARMRTSEFLKNLDIVFSPITHCHPMALAHEMPKRWDFWGHIDLNYIDACSEVWVLKMPHWEQSTGITAEIAHAEANGIPVKYLECPDYSEE